MTNDTNRVIMSGSAGSAGQGQYQDPNATYPHPNALRRPQGVEYGLNDHGSAGIQTEQSAATPRGIEDGSRAQAYLDHMMSLQSPINKISIE